MTKRIMRTFKLNEISAVDFPAQAGARMTILKRDSSQDNPEGDINMDIKDVQKMIDDAVKTATVDISKQLATTTSQLEAITKAKTPPKAADDMSEPDADDATAKAWRPYVAKMVANAVAKAKEEHDAEIAKSADVAKTDETLEHDGVVLRKSVIGEDQFKVMKSLTETNEINAFTKRADAEIPALPGTAIAKAKALRAVSKLAKEDREVVEAMLKGGNAAMKAQMTTLGKDGNGDDTAEGQIEKAVTALMATDKTLTKAVAYTKVLDTAEGKALYAKSLTEKTPRAA